MFLTPINTTQLQLVAKLIGVCSSGSKQLIDLINEVGGNQVKIRQAVVSCVGIRISLFKKNSKAMSNAFMLYLRGKIMEISCACVCVSFTPHSVVFLLVFYPARVSACSGVIGLVCVPSCKDEGVWLVLYCVNNL